MSYNSEMMLLKTTATIASGASLSGTVDLGDKTLVAIELPSAWTTANITLQASSDNSTFNNVYDINGGEVTITAAASRYIVVSPVDFVSFRYLKLRSGTSGTAQNQAASRTINLIYRGV